MSLTVLFKCLVNGRYNNLNIQVFGTLYMNEGLDKQLAVERAVNVFANLDVDGDGDITEVKTNSEFSMLLTTLKFLYLKKY